MGYELEDINGIIDNLLQTQVISPDLTAYIHNVYTQDSRFMDFLSVLCVCNGQPIAEHQSMIATTSCILYPFIHRLYC